MFANQDCVDFFSEAPKGLTDIFYRNFKRTSKLGGKACVFTPQFCLHKSEEYVKRPFIKIRDKSGKTFSTAHYVDFVPDFYQIVGMVQAYSYFRNMENFLRCCYERKIKAFKSELGYSLSESDASKINNIISSFLSPDVEKSNDVIYLNLNTSKTHTFRLRSHLQGKKTLFPNFRDCELNFKDSVIRKKHKKCIFSNATFDSMKKNKRALQTWHNHMLSFVRNIFVGKLQNCHLSTTELALEIRKCAISMHDGESVIFYTQEYHKTKTGSDDPEYFRKAFIHIVGGYGLDPFPSKNTQDQLVRLTPDDVWGRVELFSDVQAKLHDDVVQNDIFDKYPDQFNHLDVCVYDSFSRPTELKSDLHNPNCIYIEVSRSFDNEDSENDLPVDEPEFYRVYTKFPILKCGKWEYTRASCTSFEVEDNMFYDYDSFVAPHTKRRALFGQFETSGWPKRVSFDRILYRKIDTSRQEKVTIKHSPGIRYVFGKLYRDDDCVPGVPHIVEVDKADDLNFFDYLGIWNETEMKPSVSGFDFSTFNLGLHAKETTQFRCGVERTIKKRQLINTMKSKK